MRLIDRILRRPTPPPPIDDQEVAAMVAESQQQHAAALRRRSVVNDLTRRVNEQARRNHFGETVDAIYRRRHA